MFNVITCSFQTLIEMATKYFIFIVSIVATKHINIAIFYKHCQISLQKECTQYQSQCECPFQYTLANSRCYLSFAYLSTGSGILFSFEF